MPSSFGLWFGAYAEGLADDMLFLQAAYRMTNRNPLGSAAGYGSSFPLNRTMTTQLLGFDSMDYNVVYAQMGRGKMERNVAFAMATVAGTLAKMAFDACMFNCQNFGFVKLPKECTTGSSIMPHKKNNFTPCKDIHHTHEGSIGNLCNDKIEELMNHTLSEFHFERMENAEKELLK